MTSQQVLPASDSNGQGRIFFSPAAKNLRIIPGKKNMKLLFISSEQYPNGGAAVNRHLAYAKGLEELGHHVSFILLNKQQWKDGQLVEGNIEFLQPAFPDSSPQSKTGRLTFLLKSIRDAKRKIFAESNKAEPLSVILLDTDIVVLIPLLNYCKKLDIRVYHERTEYPDVVTGKALLKRVKLFIYLKWVVGRFNGIYVINQALRRYFLEITNGRLEVWVVNMIVDPSRFNCPERTSDSETVISYCGTLQGDKDGVPILVRSFALIASEFPRTRLQLIGSLKDPSTKAQLLTLIKECGVESRVLLTGAVTREKIPELLCNSDILALSRPANKQAEGGFPTKLGEYLATGKVAVVTAVGEIPRFLTDQKNAFIAEPDSAEKFAEKLKEALLSEERVKIGLEGRKLVFDEFNYLAQARVLETRFMEGWISKK